MRRVAVAIAAVLLSAIAFPIWSPSGVPMAIPASHTATPTPQPPRAEVVRPATAPAASGVFRVTLNGFTVIHETKDDPLEGDGKRDEVYIVSEVWMFDRNGNSTLRRSYKSSVMGDPTNRTERVPAGTATPGMFGGQVGGLRTGDSVPPREPWRRASAGFGNQDRVPIKLWEGELVQGQNVVAIMPTVWEWDNTDISETETEWPESVQGWLTGHYRDWPQGAYQREVGTAGRQPAKTQLTNLISQWRSGVPVVQTFGVLGFSIKRSSVAGNRPVGISDSGDGGFLFFTPLVHLEVLTPSVLSLTYESAMDAVASSTTDKGPGIFEMTFHDLIVRDRRYARDPDGGQYRLYLQVERVR